MSPRSFPFAESRGTHLPPDAAWIFAFTNLARGRAQNLEPMPLTRKILRPWHLRLSSVRVTQNNQNDVIQKSAQDLESGPLESRYAACQCGAGVLARGP